MASPAPRIEPERPDFRSLYDDWCDYVWLFLRRLGVREADLEDATQEVFTVVFRRFADYDPARPFRPWLNGIAVRVAARERRRPQNTREQLTEADDFTRMPGRGPTPEAAMAQAQRRARAFEALDALPEDQRAVFVLHDLQGVGCPEIAATLDESVNTIYYRLKAARQRFAALVKRWQVTGGEA